jgi:uncharacterized membrane protein YdjX (TVP38/TMEM64 family)
LLAKKRRLHLPNWVFGILIFVWACGVVLIFVVPASILTVVIGVVFAAPLIIGLTINVIGSVRDQRATR